MKILADFNVHDFLLLLYLALEIIYSTSVQLRNVLRKLNKIAEATFADLRWDFREMLICKKSYSQMKSGVDSILTI